MNTTDEFISLDTTKDGCIGTSPTRYDSTVKTFMADLLDKNLIDHMVFSIYSNPARRTSHFKFGSMDLYAF